ncbi:hypothetical protein NUW58_g7013 [Xylaria curta]|uniref:Uncharacterized protein n=1 Tax=Xylaria curta TaxID=42375 RepID=A0ACC1NMQ0_9PEZI|nr:hypothetical protein NUW58_g7013 [Xylaria curta]
MTPTPTLLFQYSALSYNAHRIHFDRSYCREAEGHKDLLVHGPLSLTLMLSVLQSQLAREGDVCEFIDSISYRHLAPLYVNQPMRICVKLQEPTAAKHGKEDLVGKGQHSEEEKKDKDEEQIDTTKQLEAGRNKWNLWVENQEGSLCVKGTAETIKRRTLSETG